MREALSPYLFAISATRRLGVPLPPSAPAEVSLLELPAGPDVSSGVVASDAASDAWLCELTLKEGPSEVDASTNGQRTAEMAAGAPVSKGARLGRRTSDKGFRPMRIDQYLELLDGTRRQIRESKPGSIPLRLSPILERLQRNRETWVETVRHFGLWFKRAAGRGVSLAQAAARSGRRWFQGQTFSQDAYTYPISTKARR